MNNAEDHLEATRFDSEIRKRRRAPVKQAVETGRNIAGHETICAKQPTDEVQRGLWTMNVIVVTKRGGPHQFSFSHPLAFCTLAFFSVSILAAMFLAGYLVAAQFLDGGSQARLGEWRARLAEQATAVEKAKQDAQANINALSLKLGQLQAHIIRLDALGQQLTKMAGLDQGEFNFQNPPGEGGPEVAVDAGEMSAPEFLHSLDSVAAQIKDREQQLSVLENLLMNRNLQSKVRPAGRPVENGWISSYFGLRTDPFTGRLERHEGMDFAGKAGSRVGAVAAGVVTWAGPRYGYGNLVEIDHGNGYTTRYGHNEKILVQVGQTVKKGQTIALMGSTGRSTGPHVHFEVRYNGVPVNPRRYVEASTH